MKLDRKKKLAMRTLKKGKDKIKFDVNRIDEIKEAITKQDIKDLVKSKAIIIKEDKGKRKNKKKNKKRSTGKIKKLCLGRDKKQRYVKLTRKLRDYVYQLRRLGMIDVEEYKGLRRRIRASEFRSKRHLKEVLELEKSMGKKLKEDKK